MDESNRRRSLSIVIGGISLTSAAAILVGMGSVQLFGGARRDLLLVLFSVTAVAGLLGGYVFGPHLGAASTDRSVSDPDRETLV